MALLTIIDLKSGKTMKKSNHLEFPFFPFPLGLSQNIVYHPNCSQCSSTPGPSPCISLAVVSLTTRVSPSGPHAATSTRWFEGVLTTAWRMSVAISGLPGLMACS